MSDIAIRVERLGKAYRIGLSEQRHETLFGAAASFVKSPLSNFQNLRKLSRFEADDEEDVIWALKDLSFEVKRGEAVGIIGRNGAGKSTLLKILARITEPTRGRAEIHGRVGSLLEVGTGFHPDLTGRENVYLNGTILGMKKREVDARFDEIVDFSGVEKFIDTPVKRYSSGMRVRLAFAVAAHLEPEILIVDEVLAVGDAEFQKKCLGKMQDVAGQGRTVLFVSHNMSAVTTLCQRAILLKKGQLSRDATAGKVVEDYLALNAGHAGDTWEPHSHDNPSALIFSSASIAEYRLGMLRFQADLRTAGRHRPAFVAFDLTDRAGTPIMQILPEVEPFLQDSNRLHRVEVEVEMPPLIPGRYFLDLWVGSHFSETYDHVRGALAFQSVESPTTGRSFPHSPSHGFLVPKARLLHNIGHDSQD